jgi:hypothetical protein
MLRFKYDEVLDLDPSHPLVSQSSSQALEGFGGHQNYSTLVQSAKSGGALCQIACLEFPKK